MWTPLRQFFKGCFIITAAVCVLCFLPLSINHPFRHFTPTHSESEPSVLAEVGHSPSHRPPHSLPSSSSTSSRTSLCHFFFFKLTFYILHLYKTDKTGNGHFHILPFVRECDTGVVIGWCIWGVFRVFDGINTWKMQKVTAIGKGRR